MKISELKKFEGSKVEFLYRGKCLQGDWEKTINREGIKNDIRKN